MKPARNQSSYTRFWLSVAITLAVTAGAVYAACFLPPWPPGTLFLVLRILAGAVCAFFVSVPAFVFCFRYIVFGQGIPKPRRMRIS